MVGCMFVPSISGVLAAARAHKREAEEREEFNRLKAKFGSIDPDEYNRYRELKQQFDPEPPKDIPKPTPYPEGPWHPHIGSLTHALLRRLRRLGLPADSIDSLLDFCKTGLPDFVKSFHDEDQMAFWAIALYFHKVISTQSGAEKCMNPSKNFGKSLHGEVTMSAIDIKPLPGANGDIKQGIKNLCDSIPKDTVIVRPYVFKIIPHPGKEASND